MIPTMRHRTFCAIDRNSASTDGQCPLTFSPGIQETVYLVPLRTTRICLSPGAINACPRTISSPFSASFTFIWQIRSSRSAYICVNPGGICCTITMPGIFAGRRRSTSRVASVPPVDAPKPIITSVGATPILSGRDAIRLLDATGLSGERRTRAHEATTILLASASINRSFPSVPSGFRTKSTAPTAIASKTRRFKDETRIIGIG